MKLEKIKNMKQKIITIPIIMITLISFIIPNYSHAGVLDGVLNNVLSGLMYIPDCFIWFLEKSCIDSDISYSDIFKKDDDLKNYLEDTMNQGTILDGNISGIGAGITWALIKTPIIGGIIQGISDDTITMISNIKISPMSIFANEIPLFDVNFFSPKKNDKSVAYNIRNVISVWYVALRNISLVLSLLVLVFIGIKITVSSVASDKAKYKQLLVDWIVGICLILFAHYIMVFSVNIIESLDKMIVYNTKDSDVLINIARTKAGTFNATEDALFAEQFLWGMVYIALTAFTFIFAWQYMVRVVKMIFLTLFAPIFAFSYPLDKMMDGKSQAFDRWIKDYIFTLLIQPIHLLLYTILISSVIELATSNFLYSLVVLGCFIPVEKLIREFFNFGRGHIKGPNPAGLFTAMTLGSKAINAFKPSNIKNGKSDGGKQSNGNDIKPIDISRGDRAIDLLTDGEDKIDSGNQKIRDYSDEYKNDNQEDTKEVQDGVGQDMPGKNDEEFKISDNQQDYDRLKAIQNDNKIDTDTNRYTEEEKDLSAERLKNEFNNIDEENTGKIERDNKDNKKFGKIKDKFGMVGNRFKSAPRDLKSLANSNIGLTARSGVKKGLKIAAATTVGTAAAVMAGAAMLPSGDIIKTGEAMVAGVAAGSTFTSKALNSTDKKSSFADSWKQKHDPSGYMKKLQREQADEDYRKIINDKNAMLQLRTKAQKYNMSDKQLKDTIRNYSDNGITDYKEIGKGIQLQKEKGATEREAMGVVQIAKKYSESAVFEKENITKSRLVKSLQGQVRNPEQVAEKKLDLLKAYYE